MPASDHNNSVHRWLDKDVNAYAEPVTSAAESGGPPSLFDALVRFWTRWGRGVPANWPRDHVALLCEVSRAGICLQKESWADGSGRTAFEIRRGQQADWPSGWFRSPVDYTWIDTDEFRGEVGDPSSLVLGYMADSVEHRFACNLPRKAELVVLEMTAEGAKALGRPEAAVADKMLELAGRWSQLPGTERGRIQKTVRFAAPQQPYHLLALPDGRTTLGLTTAGQPKPPA